MNSKMIYFNFIIILLICLIESTKGIEDFNSSNIEFNYLKGLLL